MTTAFSTKSNQNIEDPLYRLLFSDEDEKQKQPKNKVEESKLIKDEKKTINIQTEIQIDEPKIESIAIKPETELDMDDKSSRTFSL